MRFPHYQDFEVKFQRNYGLTLSTYPMIERCFGLEFRNFMGGYDAIARRNLMRRAERYAPADPILRRLGRSTSAMDQVSLDLPGFKDIRTELEHRFQDDGLDPLSKHRILGVSAQRILRKLATLGRSYADASKLMAKHGPDALLAEKHLLDRLEGDLTRNFKSVLDFTRRQRIRAFISQGDGKPHERVFCAVAKDVGIPFVVLSHGYVSEPHLISVAPLYADAFVAWTEDQKRELARAVPERADDFHCFGFPTKIGGLSRRETAEHVVLVWEPLILSGLLCEHAPRIIEIAKQVRDAGYVPLFRAHPKETKAPEINAFLSDAGILPDTQDLKASLASAHAIVSSNSSVLTEAAFCGCLALQIEELKSTDYEGAVEIPLEQVGYVLKDPLVAKTVETAFDTGAFYTFLTGLMSNRSSVPDRTAQS